MRIAHTERTTIDQISTRDAPFMLALLNSPTWIRFIGDRNVHTVEEAQAHVVTRYLGLYQAPGYGYYAVRLLDGRAIGICGFLQKPYLENVDFGFAMLPEFQRQGYGFEAAWAVLEFGARQCGLSVLDAVTVTDNVASTRLLEALHFTHVGEVRVPDTDERLQLYRRVRPPESGETT